MNIFISIRNWFCAAALILMLPLTVAAGGKQALVAVGIDEKVLWDDAGKIVLYAPGKDMVLIMDIGTDPLAPRIIAKLPLMNSIFGPPTNLQITPDESLALVANSVTMVQDGAAWKSVPDNKLYVIDLKAAPPALIDTIEVGKQPSGMSINSKGTLALIANRADNSISVVSIEGKKVKLIDTVAMGESVAAVKFTPNGKRALAVKFPNHKVAVLDVDGTKVTYNKDYDMMAGLWPYNIDVTPNGKIALTADQGNNGIADGNVDTVSVIDLEHNPPFVMDKVVVGDQPEGLAISPTGKIAVVLVINGSKVAKNAWYYHRNGIVVVLKIDGKKVTKISEVEVRGDPEGVAFSADGTYLYVANFIDSDISILKVEGTKVTNTGKNLQLPGHPASMRGPAR
jgi:DNA-binding beta-propeller fold protein YncE